MYVVCYVIFLNFFELIYNLVILFFIDVVFFWEVVCYLECDFCDGVDRQSIIDIVIVFCLCVLKKMLNICYIVNNDVLFSFFCVYFIYCFKNLFCFVQ